MNDMTGIAMQMQSKAVNGTLIISIQEKRLDSRFAVEFKNKVGELINSGNRLLVIDLSNVDFIDSSGIGCLVSCLKLLGLKGKIAIFGLNQPVEAMFRLTRMDRVFVLCSSEAQAVDAINS